jgi:adenylate cyclase
MLLSRAVTHSLHGITEETNLIRRLSFEERDLGNSRFEEIVEITNAYRSLKRGLRALEKYVPIKLVRTLLVNDEEPVLGGRVEELTIFFSDIRGFSTFSEELAPEKLADMLGQYLQTMTNVVSDSGGTVDKFIGDAVMAFWNAPRPVEEHAYKAVVAALDCQQAITKLEDAELLYTRIGIHTGRVMVGNFGARERMSYTVLGDGVNLAARLEGVNKEYGTRILISQPTFEQIRDRIACRRIDRIAVKGKSQATDIYEVLGRKDSVANGVLAAATIYEQGLDAYFAQEFNEALAKFEQALVEKPGDKAAQLMIARCRRYLVEPPPAGWTGVSAMESK